MFLLSFVNVDAGFRDCATLGAAIVAAQRAGFESRIQNAAGEVVATYSPIGGVQFGAGVLAVYPNAAEGTAAHVSRSNRGGFHVALEDTDSGDFFGTVQIFASFESAEAVALRVAGELADVSAEAR